MHACIKLDYTSFAREKVVNAAIRAVVNATEHGEMLMGLTKEDLMKYADSEIVAENWMRKKVLPGAWFEIMMEELKYPYEVYPELGRDSANPRGNRTILLKVAADNIAMFPSRYKEMRYLIEHPDTVVDKQSGMTADQVVLYAISVYDQPRGFPESSRRARQDVEALLSRGSDVAKAWLRIYGNSLAKILLPWWRGET